MKRVAWISLIFVIIEIIVAIIVLPQMNDTIPTHWNYKGEADAWGSKYSIFTFPAITIGLVLLMFVLPLIDPLGKNILRSEKAYSITIGLIVLLMAILFIVSAMIGLGISIKVDIVVWIATGILFMVIGNFLPKVKRNFFFGIRLPWTLMNDDVWVQTHRFGAWIFLAIGLLFVFSCLLPVVLRLVIPMAGLFIGIIVICVYAYKLYQRLTK